MQTRNSFTLRRVCLFLSFLLWATSVPAQENYVRTYIPVWWYAPGTVLDESNSMISTSYYDAAGRLVQTVKHSFTPQWNDMADFIDYDGLGRKRREWSFIPFDEADGKFKGRDKFIDSPHTGNHYVDYEYEPAASGRVTGEIGRNTSNMGIHREYLFNTNSVAELSVWRFKPCTYYSDELERNGKYPDGTLSCIKTTDEDGNVSYLFSDAQNRPVLERRIGVGFYDTYYVYNDWDQLVAVLPPGLISNLPYSEQTQTYYTALNEFKEYAYLYKYDLQNHRVGVKIPGADWHYMVYDGDHRLVYEQDGCQRATDEWTFYKYDGLGRVILEGVSKGFKLENMIREFSGKLVREDYTGNTSPTSFGYSENVRYLYPPTITKVYYYDTYDFLSLPLFAEWLPAAPRTWDYSGASLQTGSYVCCLEEPGFELCSFYYDHRARNTRTDRYNSISNMNTRAHQSYNFNDGINQTRTFWVGQNETCYRGTSNLYDHTNRLLTTFYHVTHEPASQHYKSVLSGDLLNYEYDEFGRIRNKIFLAQKDTVSYLYDSRSRLEQINNRYFSERLYYDKAMRNSSDFDKISRNGQITGIRIRQGDESYAHLLKYDRLNRLVESQAYKMRDTVVGPVPMSLCERMSYDRMGNMTHFYQKLGGEVVNNLMIFHRGNQLCSISKSSDNPVSPQYAHLVRGEHESSSGYVYDANGNEMKNLADGIYYSRFNRLNLPDSVLFDKSGNTTLMSYMADGKRIRTVHNTYSTGLSYLLDNVQEFNDPIHTTEEIRDGDILFRDGMVVRIELPGGYVNVREPEYNKLTAYYHVKDHLGSVRTTVSGDLRKVVQQLEYTPGGTLWRSFDQRSLQPKHFCGKEELTMHGYNMYDSGGRFHTNNGIRFVSPDPMAEKYYSWSPYAYCFGNPVRIIDPDGRDGWDVVAGYGIGIVTNIIPGSGGLRDSYAPNDPSDYNNALQGADYASVLIGDGMIKTGGTGAALGAGAVVVGVTATAGSGGTLAIGGVPVAGAGVAFIKAGATTAGAGAVLMANGKQNQEAGYNRGKKNEVTFTQGEGANAKKITVKIPDGYKKINERSKHSMPIYSNGKNYISPDKYAHNGGIWKKANSVKELKSRTTRLGTYDKDLNRIGD